MKSFINWFVYRYCYWCYEVGFFGFCSIYSNKVGGLWINIKWISEVFIGVFDLEWGLY